MKASPRILIPAALAAILGLFVWLYPADSGRPSRNAVSTPTAATTKKPAHALTPGQGAKVTAPVAIPAAKPEGVNAADFYKDAYQLYQALSDREKYILKHPTEEVDTKEAEALFAKIQAIMDLLRRAKNEAAYADWGISNPRFDTPIPQIQAVLELGRLAQWDAGYRFGSDPAGALDDLQAQSVLARSVGDQALIGNLVANALDRLAVNLIHDNLDSLTPELIQQASALLDNEPRAAEFTGGLNAESGFVQETVKALLDPSSRSQLLDMLASAGTTSRETMEAQIPTVQAQSDWLRQTERDFAQKALLPDAEFNAWWNGVQEEAKSRPFAEATLPALAGARSTVESVTIERAMLTSGLSILQGGPGGMLDPSTGQPFTYVQTPAGFELRSPFSYKNKPIVMTFVAPGK